MGRVESDFDQSQDSVLKFKLHFHTVFDQVRSHADSVVACFFQSFSHRFDRLVTFHVGGKFHDRLQVQVVLHDLFGHLGPVHASFKSRHRVASNSDVNLFCSNSDDNLDLITDGIANFFFIIGNRDLNLVEGHVFVVSTVQVDFDLTVHFFFCHGDKIFDCAL